MPPLSKQRLHALDGAAIEMAFDAHRLEAHLRTARSMLERIRAAIGAELLALGVSDLSDLRETILIRDGLFCGRKFRCCGHSVVWFMEENEIKFFGPGGELLLASSPEQCLDRQERPQQRAA
jgi:hypothetical protein